MIKATVLGASGYTGGELLRLLIAHPKVEVVQATSRQKLGEYLYQTHPNLRGQTTLKFTDPADLQPTDVLFLALPHGQAQHHIAEYAQKAEYIVDLSADFRLRDPDFYQKWYGKAHAAPEWLDKFVYGLPELYRDALKTAHYVSGVGCNATAVNLGLLPLVSTGLLETHLPIIAELKVGSSEGGASVNPGSPHPERSNTVRTYAPYGHRHTAEVIQESGLSDVSLTITSVGLVRGALATVHGTVKDGVALKDLWKAYRAVASENPFIRIVKERRGIYRVPEPKILAGSNYADLGFDLNPETGHVISICAIDNLMKGASGSAVQSMNLMLGFEETLGLEFMGLHPI
jgi:N-acetyl-gamma-glutamyl-phosphate/LysW-gamma-L-alpha-aminoadipyl-6-phosphate reductase